MCISFTFGFSFLYSSKLGIFSLSPVVENEVGGRDNMGVRQIAKIMLHTRDPFSCTFYIADSMGEEEMVVDMDDEAPSHMRTESRRTWTNHKYSTQIIVQFEHPTECIDSVAILLKIRSEFKGNNIMITEGMPASSYRADCDGRLYSC